MAKQQWEIVAAWQKEHTTRYTLRLNHNTDADIIEALDGKQKMTEIKRLIRLGIQYEKEKEQGE